MAGLSSDERAAARREFGRLLSARAQDADVRRVMTTREGHDETLWREIAALGLTALLVPESYHGIEGTAQDAAEMMEEAGAALLSSAFLWSSIIATSLICLSTDDEVKPALLPALAGGETIATVALGSSAGLWTPDSVKVRATQTGGRWRLDGSAGFVAIVEIATSLIVVASAPEGLNCFAVARDAIGIEVSPLARAS